MKKWILLGLVAAGAGGFFYLRGQYQQGAEVAAPDRLVDLTPAEVRADLRSEDPKRRLDAVAQLEKLPPQARRAALIEALDADSAPTRLTAVVALKDGFATDPAAVGALLGAARDDPDTDVREAALGALVASGDSRVLTLAVETLSATDAPLSVKLQAAMTLDRLTGRETAPALGDAVESAIMAADELAMDWDDWLGERGENLRWDAAAGRFVGE